MSRKADAIVIYASAFLRKKIQRYHEVKSYEKVATYLSERIYKKRESERIDQKKYEYWRKMLGKDIVDGLYIRNEKIRGYFNNAEYDVLYDMEKVKFSEKETLCTADILKDKVFLNHFMLF